MNLNHVNYKQYENISQYINHPLGLSNFSLQALITQEEKLALFPLLFSVSTAASISLISSCGNLIPFVADLLFLCPVAIENPFLNCLYTLTEKRDKKKLDVFMHLNYYWCINTRKQVFKKANAQVCGNILERSNHHLTKTE